MKHTKVEMLTNAVSQSERRRIDMQVPDDLSMKSCRQCDWYDGYEGESCENPERAQCIDHSLFEERMEPPCEAVTQGPVDCDCDCEHCEE
jgi:hypothetical protein